MNIRRWIAVGITLPLLEYTAFAAAPALPAWLTNSVNAELQVHTETTTVPAEAAIVMEAETGTVLFEQAADEQLPMASTTKIMTAMLTLEQPDLDTEFVVDPGAIHVEGSSMGLKEGDTVTLRTLAVGMLLPSGNDAACAAAVRISGSAEAFAAVMNQRAASLGLTGTSFQNPAGLDDTTHYSTARDLANLTREALQHPEFLRICSQESVSVSFGNPPYSRTLTNHNKLLKLCEGTIGVKTGFTDDAGRCLVSAAERNGVRLICVTLHCADDWNVHQTLYDTYFDTVRLEDITQDFPPTTIPVTGGTADEVEAIPYEKINIPVLTQGADIAYCMLAPKFLYAPVTAGQRIGELQVYRNEESLCTLPLVAAQDVPMLHEPTEPHGLLGWLARLIHRK